MAAVLAADLPGAREDLAGHEEGDQALDDLLEGRASIHQVVLMTPVAIALPVAVVLVDEHFLPIGQQAGGVSTTDLDDALARLLMNDEVPGVRDLGTRVLGMRVIDVVASTVDERLVPSDVLLVVRRVLLAIHLEPARIRQRILLVVVPEDVAARVFPVCVDQQHTSRDGIEVRIILDHDAELDFRAHYCRYGHRISARVSRTRLRGTAPARRALLRSIVRSD